MMILAVKSLLLLSLLTFLGTHARNLPEDFVKISNVDYGLTSRIASIIRPPRKSPPSPQVNPPIHPIMSDNIIRMPRFIGKTHSPPPPAPYVAPPHDQANAYQRGTSIFATRGTTLEPSHFSQQVPKDNEIIRMPRFIGKTHSPPPPAPYVAPPHDQANAYQRWTSIFATRGTTLEPSHFSQQVPKDNEIIKRPHLSSPPPPHLAPPHIQMEI